LKRLTLAAAEFWRRLKLLIFSGLSKTHRGGFLWLLSLSAKKVARPRGETAVTRHAAGITESAKHPKQCCLKNKLDLSTPHHYAQHHTL
jgi:hypothetical protein